MTPPNSTESVWDYPRPPRLEPTSSRIRVIHHDIVLADTTYALRVLETSHPPVYYIPPIDIENRHLRRSPAGSSFCEFKGIAIYFTIDTQNPLSDPIAWSYPNPSPAYAALRNYTAFYASRVDECWVDDELVTPQPGDFYGGWITSRITGPFKGPPGTLGW